MKSSIGTFLTDGFIMFCDGKKVEIIGTSEIADNIRTIINNPKSTYSALAEEKGDSFNPVEYIHLSSMNFLPDIDDYSPEALEIAKKRLANASKSS
jgi:hypothetical protein